MKFILPDAHAYIRTDTHKQPVTEYEAIREKASSQKRDLERALTRFMAKTGSQSNEHSLFPDEKSSLFPLIPINVKSFTYLSALLPRDQIFEDDQQDEVKGNGKAKKDDQPEENEENKDENKEDDNENSSMKDSFNKDNDTDFTDNPYLRPTKIVCRRGTKLINFSK